VSASSRILSSLAGAAARRPWLVIAVAVVLALAGVGFALRLHPTAATSTFVSSSSPEYQATQRFYKSFGEEPVAVLVKGSLQQLVLSSDIERLAGLEGCLAGKVPASALAAEGGVNGPCGRLARGKTVKVVFGPGTFLSEAAERSDELLTAETHQAEAQAKQAEKVVYRAAIARGLGASHARTLAQQAHKVELGRFEESLATLALEYGLTARPSIEDANFVSDVVFDSTKTAGTPKSRFAYLFPSPDAALVSVRMKAGISEAARIRTIGLIRQAVKMPQWHLTHGESYLVTGEPVIVSDLTSSISHSIELLLIAVLLVMAGTLGLVFSGRPRLLPLALALLAAALTFGALSLVGASLTMASIAVLPVLVGLAVDYAIQFQARVGDELERDAFDEAVAAGTPALVQRAAALGAPTIVAAGAASAAAMLVLLLSPVPMVRGFGVLLVVGVAIALVCALTVGAAAISLSLRTTTAVGGGALAGTPLAVAWRGARELVADNPLTRLFTRAALVGTVRHPGRVLCAGLVLAALGWGLDTQTKVQTDITKLVPQSLGSLQSLNTLERITGVGGEIDVMIEASNLTKLATIEWMTAYQKRVLARFGYSAAKGCSKARLCPAFSLPDLFGGQPTAGSAITGAAATTTGSANAPKLSQRLIDGLLGVIPPYFSQDVITPDRRVATLAFGIRLMSLDEQQQLIEQMRSSLHPPAGVHATLVGLPVLAAASGSQVADPWRRLETLLVGLVAVALVLLLAFRGDRRRALVPLVPIVMATGWSALILFAVRVPLNPMSVTLGALVIAISTEFSVLLSERHRQERLAGYDTIEALRRSYRRTGTAVAASGATATMGFGVLVLSEITMLRDFGLVTLIDLSVSLVGVLLALPATLVIADAAAEGGRDRRALSDLGSAARRLRGALVRS
jgi:predicted RND superfamily exporter protein